MFARLALCTLLTIAASAEEFSATEVSTNRKAAPRVKESFSPFTGKISANKVRIRLYPDLDSSIVTELSKNDYVAVTAQEGNFYRVEPPESMKAYIFRSFVLDGFVEGNRVNVRLAPDLEAPVIGHANSGDPVEGVISTLNKKWLEITPPESVHFYVAKDYIEYAGGPELKQQMAMRRESVGQLLEGATLFSASELEKDFEEIDFGQVKKGFLTIINDYNEFSKAVGEAKEALTAAQESYLEKRIAYLEEKAGLVSNLTDGKKHPKRKNFTQLWESVENGLYATWADANDGRSLDAFYDEQKMTASAMTGVLEVFKSPVRNKPGDYILKNKNLPVAYLYSTNIDLSEFVGQKVKLVGSERNNNDFAFPAYYVHSVE